MPTRFNLMRLLTITILVTALGFVVSVIHFQQAVSSSAQSAQERPSQEPREPAQPPEHIHVAVMAGLLAMLFVVLFVIARRTEARFEEQARTIAIGRQRLLQLDRQALLGRMVAGVARQITTPVAFSKSNVFMVIQALEDITPGIREASRLLDNATVGQSVGVGGVSGPMPLDVDPVSVCSRISRCPDEILVTQDMLSDVLMGLDQIDGLLYNLRQFTLPDPVRSGAVNLNNLVSCVSSIARAVIPSQVKIVENVSQVPPIDGHVAKLNQAFLNVILHIAQEIDGAGEITVTTFTADQHIRVCFDCTGAAWSDDVLTRHIDPDFATAPTEGDPGLGLSIARDIVTEHGGSISLMATAGGGTTVQIELPVSACAAR